MIAEYVIDYATDKDSMTRAGGWAHVRVSAESPLAAQLLAEQMVMATGRQPLSLIRVG